MIDIHSLTAEWLPVSIVPSDNEDLEVCVVDYDGIVPNHYRTRVTKAGPDGSMLLKNASTSSRPIGQMDRTSLTRSRHA